MDKNIVFDFDQTIGYFEQIIEIIIYTKKTSKTDVTKDDVFNLFALYIENFIIVEIIKI
jgi:hypothetical protein